VPLLLLAILAVVQGITEFLPISSSGHLDLTWAAFHAADAVPEQIGRREELILDVAMHVGTLLAVCIYNWQQLWQMLLGLLRLLTGKFDQGARLVLLLIVATIPVVIAGLLIKDSLPDLKGNLALIGWTTLGYGILLYIADRVGMTMRRIEHLRFGDVIVMGLAQALALIPGTSRSGITMTAGRFLGMERQEAARFSLLMSIPTIAAAGILAGLDLQESGNVALTADALIGGFLAFVSALIAIALMMAWLRRASFTPFVIYRVIAGGALLILVYSGLLASWGLA